VVVVEEELSAPTERFVLQLLWIQLLWLFEREEGEEVAGLKSDKELPTNMPEETPLEVCHQSLRLVLPLPGLVSPLLIWWLWWRWVI